MSDTLSSEREFYCYNCGNCLIHTNEIDSGFCLDCQEDAEE